MKRLIVAAFAFCTLSTLAAAPGSAQGAGLDGFLTGVNGLLTWPADPVCDAIFPPEDFEEFPGKAVIGYPLGLVYGTGLGLYRATTGVIDILLTPLWVVPEVSPTPRFDVIPFYELEEAL
jgi:hypothetical protein